MARFLMITATSGTNFELAEKFAENAISKGHETDVIDLAEMDLPMFTVARSKSEEAPDISELVKKMTEADAWVIVAPEYNGSMPPTLNNAIAWMSTAMNWQDFRALCTGPVGLATHSGGGGAHVIMAMRQQFSFIGADVMGRACLSGRDREANLETIDAMIDNLVR